VDVLIHIFLTSALDGGEWSASCPGRFIPWERVTGTHWIGGWVNHRAGLDDVEKRKFLTLPGLELRPLGRPARSQSLSRPKEHRNCWYNRTNSFLTNPHIGHYKEPVPLTSVSPKPFLDLNTGIMILASPTPSKRSFYGRLLRPKLCKYFYFKDRLVHSEYFAKIRSCCTSLFK
jgi:hypothetical protein